MYHKENRIIKDKNSHKIRFPKIDERCWNFTSQVIKTKVPTMTKYTIELIRFDTSDNASIIPKVERF